MVGKELGGELKKRKDRNGKTGLNPLKDVRRSVGRYILASWLYSYIKQRRKTFDKLNFAI